MQAAIGDQRQVKLGRYEVVRELGKGAMGIVYLAKDPLIGRLVALKTIRLQNSDDDEAKEFQQRFVREAQAAGILNHPSIVTVHDIGQDDATGVSFIAMEYVEGQNLKEILAQGRPLTFEQIGEIIGQIADALDFAQPTLGGQLLERLGRDRHSASRAAVGAQAVALLAGDLQALGDLLEQPRHDQVAGAAVRAGIAGAGEADRRWAVRPG